MTLPPIRLYSAAGRVEAVDGATAVTLGVFDGVHRGHQALLEQLVSLASSTGGGMKSLVVTLTSHPSFVLGRRTSEYWLDDPEEHERLLLAAGVHYVAELPFTAEVARLTACQMARLLHERLNMRALLLGYDSRFGSKADDDFDRLPHLASELGFYYDRGEPFLLEGEPISSSRIRSSLEEGRVEETQALLGRPYSLSGVVSHGRGVGHSLGFPTANIDLAGTRKMMPREGVYAVKVKSEQWKAGSLGMANLGPMPTFGIERPTLEVHLLGYDGDLYGQTVTVEFVHRLRDIMRFSSAEALQEQLAHDLKDCRQYE
ncbi:MAG: riboflavin biosynthesis protein RibF [Bacteroidales bacterium]|nr:riboflavin biosynthesis protein RibF [Bacteroidales bacterium]